MHIKQLKVFCDVAAGRSVSRAASENGITQSAASQMVQQLEERLGVKLLDRAKRPLGLTSEGEMFYRGSRKLVSRYFALEEEVRHLHQEVAGRVRVASIYSVGLTHMNRSVQDFLSRFPQSNVRLEYQHPDRVYELVQEDQADVGLVSYPRAGGRILRVIPWRDEPMVMVCSPEHALANRLQVEWMDFHGRSMVSFDSNLRIRREIDRALAARGVEVSVVMEFDNIETIKRAIEIDAGVGLLPAPTVTREVSLGSLVAVPVAQGGLVRPLGIIQRQGKEPSAATRRFVELLLEKADPVHAERSATGRRAAGTTSGMRKVAK